jgi:hypothetical protein
MLQMSFFFVHGYELLCWELQKKLVGMEFVWHEIIIFYFILFFKFFVCTHVFCLWRALVFMWVVCFFFFFNFFSLHLWFLQMLLWGTLFFLLFCSFFVWSYDHDVHIVMKSKSSSLCIYIYVYYCHLLGYHCLIYHVHCWCKELNVL